MSVGIDIGTRTIKAVELETEGGKFGLKSAGVISYADNPLSATSDEKAMVPLVEAIKKLLKDAKIGTKEALLAIPESEAFTRVIKFPLLSTEEIASAVKWEAEQYIPIPVAEAIIQHEVIEKRETTTPPEVLVLLVAAPRVLVEKYTKVLSMAGLTTEIVESAGVALVRSLAPTNQTAVIIDFGANSTVIVVAKNAQLVFSRSIPTAGEALTRAVAQALGVTPQQAEEYKRTYGFSNQLEGKVASALSPVFASIGEEIKKAVHFYTSEQQQAMPTSLIVTGGGAGIPEISGMLAKATGLEVIIGNPFAKVTVDPAVAQKLAPYSPLYSIALGIALRTGEK
jgi:type IV pilus assembly protein PilM